MPSRSSLVAFVLIPVLMAGAAGLYVHKLNGVDREKLLNQFSDVIAPDNDAIIDSDDAMRASISTYGLAPTMRVLINAASHRGIDCHNRAHQFGRMSYEIFGEEAMKLNLPECHSGYYHGAIEAYFKKNGVGSLKEKIDFICPANLNVFFMHQCLHGLGHGLMSWSDYDLPGTLEFCNMITPDNGKASCRTGVFMENIVQSLTSDTSIEAKKRGHFTKYLSDDPQYPCDIVKDPYKNDCYFLQTDRMLTLSKIGFQGVVDGCSKAPVASQYSCFASMGRTLGGSTRGRPEEAIRTCQLIPDHTYRLACIDGASKDTFWDISGEAEGLRFCSLVPSEDGKHECYLGIITMAQGVLNPDQQRDFCKKIPEDAYADCMKGL